MLRDPNTPGEPAMHRIDIPDERLQAHAATLRRTLGDLLDRLYARDPGLTAARLAALRVADGDAADQPPVTRSDAGDGFTLLLAAPFVEHCLGGEPDRLLPLVHALHRELWRGELAAQARPTMAGDALAAQFSPIATLMFDEYRANLHSAWSLPDDADLLLPHLLRLLEELPRAGERALADYRVDGDLDTLVGLSVARLTHLMQTVAFSLGYLAGLGRTAGDIAPELKAGIDASLIGREWPRIAALLAGAAASDGAARELQLDMLRTRIVALLAALGLTASLAADGSVWMEVADASEALSRRGPLH